MAEIFNFMETVYPAEIYTSISPLDFAYSYGSVNMFELLLKYDKTDFQNDCIQILISAVTTGNVEIVEYIALKIQGMDHTHQDLRCLLQVCIILTVHFRNETKLQFLSLF